MKAREANQRFGAEAMATVAVAHAQALTAKEATVAATAAMEVVAEAGSAAVAVDRNHERHQV
jgi:hypothetical protein